MSDRFVQGRLQYLGILHLLDRSCRRCVPYLLSRNEQVFVWYLRFAMACSESCFDGMVSRATSWDLACPSDTLIVSGTAFKAGLAASVST